MLFKMRKEAEISKKRIVLPTYEYVDGGEGWLSARNQPGCTCITRNGLCRRYSVHSVGERNQRDVVQKVPLPVWKCGPGSSGGGGAVGLCPAFTRLQAEICERCSFDHERFGCEDAKARDGKGKEKERNILHSGAGITSGCPSAVCTGEK